MDVTLYTTHCPLCRVLESKLNTAGIKYEINENVEEIIKLGYSSVPILVVNGNDMNFKEACTWADSIGGNNAD